MARYNKQTPKKDTKEKNKMPKKKKIIIVSSAISSIIVIILIISLSLAFTVFKTNKIEYFTSLKYKETTISSKIDLNDRVKPFENTFIFAYNSNTFLDDVSPSDKTIEEKKERIDLINNRLEKLNDSINKKNEEIIKENANVKTPFSLYLLDLSNDKNKFFELSNYGISGQFGMIYFIQDDKHEAKYETYLPKNFKNHLGDLSNSYDTEWADPSIETGSKGRYKLTESYGTSTGPKEYFSSQQLYVNYYKL